MPQTLSSWRSRGTVALFAIACMLFACTTESFAQQVPDISGIWNAAASANDGKWANRGELHILQSGQAIEAVSTIGKSAWRGTLSGRTLLADWRSNENAGQLKLTLSLDGRTLDGSWTSPTGGGSYRATKSKQSPNY
jgi:hypothetical protein